MTWRDQSLYSVTLESVFAMGDCILMFLCLYQFASKRTHLKTITSFPSQSVYGCDLAHTSPLPRLSGLSCLISRQVVRGWFPVYLPASAFLFWFFFISLLFLFSSNLHFRISIPCQKENCMRENFPLPFLFVFSFSLSFFRFSFFDCWTFFWCSTKRNLKGTKNWVFRE